MIGTPTPVAFVVDLDQDERDLMPRALDIGHRPALGRLNIEDRTAGGGVPGALPLVEPIEAAPGFHGIAVRRRSEWEPGHVPGAADIEWAHPAAGRDGAGGPTLIHCGPGR